MEVKVKVVPQTDKDHDEPHLQQHRKEQVEQIQPEENQMIIVVVVDVHDFQLKIGHQIRNHRPDDQRGNHRLGLFSSHVKAAVHRVHGTDQNDKGQQRGRQRTVQMAEKDVGNGKAGKEDGGQQAIEQNCHRPDRQVGLDLMKGTGLDRHRKTPPSFRKQHDNIIAEKGRQFVTIPSNF